MQTISIAFCGVSPHIFSDISFTSNPGVGANIPYTFAVVADIGENANANSTITHVLASADTIDSVVIAGDISYASGCEANGCTTWDAFQTMAAPLAAIKPWQINIGNHECSDNYNFILAISTKYRFSGMWHQNSNDETIISDSVVLTSKA